MTVCVDTNTLIQLFGRQATLQAILNALLSGRLAIALSNSEFEHPADPLLHGGYHRLLIASGAPLETMMFDGFDAEHIGYPFV